MYLAFLEETPFLTLFGLRALFVVAPLDGVAHRRHGGRGMDCMWFVQVRRGERIRMPPATHLDCVDCCCSTTAEALVG